MCSYSRTRWAEKEKLAMAFIDEQDGDESLKREILINVQTLLLHSGLCFRKRFKIQVQEISLREKFSLLFTYAAGGESSCSFPAFLAVRGPHKTQESFRRAADPVGSTVRCCTFTRRSCCCPHLGTGKPAVLWSASSAAEWKTHEKKTHAFQLLDFWIGSKNQFTWQLRSDLLCITGEKERRGWVGLG